MIKTDVDFFNPDKICNSGQIFRMYRAEGEASVFLVYSGDRRLKITRTGKEVFFHCSDEEYESYWRHFLDMDRNYEALATMTDPKDDFLRKACLEGKGLRILNQDLFETIISFIVSQQKQIPSIRKCVESLCERFGTLHKEDAVVPYPCHTTGPQSGEENVKGSLTDSSWYGFPKPESIAAAGPNGLKGLSLGYRERYIYETSCMYARVEKELRAAVEKKDFTEVRRILLSMTGIGEKVADCILLFACGDLDSFPVDTHIISIMEREYPATDNKKTVSAEYEQKKMTPAQARERVREIFGKYKGFSGLVQQWIFAYEIRKPDSVKPEE